MDFPIDQREQKETQIEQVQSVVLRTLKIIDIVCKKHDIGYWLDYGTLLGAIRHKGFIPWDHEADIGMVRTDFEKFLSVIENELPFDLFFQCRESDPNFVVYELIEGKVRDRYSDYIDDYSKYENCNWHNGIQVDIFVYDLDHNWENCITNGFERYFSKGCIHLTFDEIDHTINKEFCGQNFPVPCGFDKYLKRAYGEYMNLPPKEQRKIPNVNVFTPCNHFASLNWNDRASIR